MDYYIQGETLSKIADAIRRKTGKVENIRCFDMPMEIENIPTEKLGDSPYYEINEIVSILACSDAIAVEPTKYYRLTITDFRRNGTQGSYASVAEFALYDANGNNIAAYDGSQLCTSNSYASTSETAYSAFDGNVNTIWHSAYSGDTASTTNWLQIGLNNPSDVVSFGITPRKDYGFDVPYAFYLSSSDDGETWNVLKEFNDISTGWTLGEERVFSLTE